MARFLWVCAMAVAAVHAQPASLEGRLVNSVSGEPVRKASLTLNPTRGRGKEAKTETESNGSFVFHDVEPGAYRLSAEKQGFQNQNYGARQNPSAGAVLTLAPGQAVHDLVFKFVPFAVISGAVMDQEGQPLPSIMVQALESRYTHGKRQWAPAGSGLTNDRGEFRLPTLSAGRYLLVAAEMNVGITLGGASPPPPSDKTELANTATYYGNTTDLSRAAPVDVKDGDDRRSLNIQMIKGPTVRVRGKAAGVPDGAVLVALLLPKGSASSSNAPGGIGLIQQNDSTFDIKNVTPGSYLLTAVNATNPTKLVAGQAIEVGDHHVEGVELRIEAGREVRGQITGAGPGVSLTLSNLDFRLPVSPSTMAKDGQFTFNDVVPGRYSLRVRGLGEGNYLKSVKQGGKAADQDNLDLSGAGEIEIIVSSGAPQLDVLVLGADEKPVSGATAALISERPGIVPAPQCVTFEDGTCTLKGLTPGKYKAMAWEDLAPGAAEDPEFVKPFESRAVPLALDENGKAKVTLKVLGEK